MRPKKQTQPQSVPFQQPSKPNSVKHSYHRDVYPGLNDISDALEALPVEIIRHFTLLREIDAKCVVHLPTLNDLINRFFSYPDQGLDEKTQIEREEVMAEIRRLIRELMPCQEEKMHVAGVAAETIKRHISRIDHDYEQIQQNEIPEEVQFGPYDHPAIVHNKANEGNNNKSSSAQSTRSESRREAIAAKKAEKEDGKTTTTTATGSGRGHGGNPSTRGRAKGAGRGAAIQQQQQQQQIQFQNQYQQVQLQQQQQQQQQQLQQHAAGGGNNGGSRKRKIHESEDGYNAYDDGNPVSRPATPTSRRSRKTANNNNDLADEPVYCYCQQVSYGEMVGCDGPDCKKEWFHLPCIGLTSPPKGQWFCEDCAAKYRRRR